MSALDTQVRLRAFAFLEEQQKLHGDALPRSVLEKGFDFEGTRVPLIGPQGIFKPAVLDLPLSFTTVPIVEGQPRPYEDEVGDDGLIRYRYRGTDPQHRDNVGLRTCLEG
jgi:putative restriction endonuclease